MASVNIALHLFGSIIILILLLSCFAEKRIDSHVPLPLLLMLIIDLLMLFVFPVGELLDLSVTPAKIGLVIFKAIHHFCFYALYYEFLLYLREDFSSNGPADQKLVVFSIPVYTACTLVWILYSALEEFLPSSLLLPLFWNLSRFSGITILFFTSVMLYRCRRRLDRDELYILIVVMLITIIGMMIRTFYPELQTLVLSATLSLLLVYGFVHQRQASRIKDQQLELSRRQNTIMLSQIRPHFLYNTLNSIYVLCGKDPSRAQEAISDFSEYLRANTGNISKPLITIDQEIEHVQHYLALEKVRFGDLLNVVYRLDAHGFLVPPLIVQPLVENAVKHGLGKRPEGGTVRVETYADQFYNYIKVSDDGAGFDPDNLPQDDDAHIGLWNVRKRLELAHGELKITSTPGKGTVILISLRR